MDGCCVFDNPRSMARECYTNGRLVFHIQLAAMLHASGIPPHVLFFGANVGPWSKGRLRGSLTALPADLLPFVAGRPCPRCEGYGGVWEKHRAIQCPACLGAGVEPSAPAGA